MTRTDDQHLNALIADLQRQRRDLEGMLDERNRSKETTDEIVDKIVELRKRSEELIRRTRK